MSMSSSVVYGYGFEIYKISDEKIIEFIKNHKEAFCKYGEEIRLYDELPNYNEEDYNYGLEEFFEDFNIECDVNGMDGYGAAISNIISRETEIRVQYERGCGNADSNPAVLFAETYPWNYNIKEKNLTVGSLTEILLPYVEELGLSKSDIDGLAIEYYG